MQIKEVTVSLGRTVNLGNFESARLDVSVTAQLAEDDELVFATALLREQCHEELVALANQQGLSIPAPRRRA